MQTIKITITSPTPSNIVLKECMTKKQDAQEKLAELFKKLQVKQEDEKNEAL